MHSNVPMILRKKGDEVKKFMTFIGSFAYSGFFPFAPATFASLVFILIFLFVPGGEYLASPYVFFPMLAVSFPIATIMEKQYGHDASCIVIDEIVAMQLILFGSDTGVAGGFLAFFIFRIFDVLKPFPIGRSQKLPGGFGVVTDDIIAGIYTRLMLVFLGIFLPMARGFGF